MGIRNLKIKIAYRGTNYHGFQRQSNAYTVQEAIEKVFSKILNEKITVHGCSRTDTGVHANEFYLNVKTVSRINPRGFVRGCNDILPDDISVLSCEDAPEDFHARFSSVGKEYVYKIHASESKNPFTTDLEYHYRRPVNMERITAACEKFIGTHDFRSFCSEAKDKENTVRTIYSFTAKKEGDLLTLTVRGDGFLYNMVRIMVGTILESGEGIYSLEDIDRLFLAGDRAKAGFTAGAHGLYLNRVFYSEEDLRK